MKEPRKSVTHELKTLPEFFKALCDGTKTFELRRNDRDFQIDDILLLKEWDGERYTGRSYIAAISYIVADGPWLMPGYCCLGLK